MAGTVPPAMCKLVQLRRLAFGYLSLRGEMPTCMHSLTSLDEADFHVNHLEGALPSILQAPAIRILHLEYNRFAGSLPDMCLQGLGGNEAFQTSGLYTCLDVSGNLLEGTLPDAISALSNIHDRLCASDNKLSGTLPESLASLKRLHFFHLSKNYLEGSLPANIGSLDGIMSLDFHMQLCGLGLEGTMPDGLGALTALHTITLAGGDHPVLEGSMPLVLGRLKLQTLMVSNTYLRGKIPALSTTLSSLFLFGSNLRGALPSKLHWLRILVPDLQYRPCFVVANNDLVCGLPRYQDLRSGHCVALFGNDFALPRLFPSWVHPHERGQFFGHPENEFRRFVLRSAILGLWLCVTFHAATKKSLLLFLHMSRLLPSLRRSLPYAHHGGVLTTRQLQQMLLIACPATLFNLGNVGYECGGTFAMLSAFKDPARNALVLVACMSSILSSGALRLNRQMSGQEHGTSGKAVGQKDVIVLLLWLLVLICTSLPGTVYCIASLIPGIFQWNPMQQFLLYHLTALVNALITRFLLQTVAQRISEDSNLSLHALLFTGRVATNWLLPAIVIVILHPRCFSYWSVWWKGCSATDKGALDIVAKIAYNDNDLETGRYLKGLVCGDGLNRGRGHHLGQALSPACARDVGAKLIRLVLGKALWLYLLTPSLNYASLALFGGRSKVDITAVVQQFASQLEMAVVFVPFFPLLAPLLLVGSLLNLSLLLIGMQKRSLRGSDPPRWPSWPMLCVVAMGWLYHFRFVSDAGLLSVGLMLWPVPVYLAYK